MRILICILLVLAISFANAQTDIYSKYYTEAKKIAEAMTLDQKIGQMTQLDM